MIPTLVGARQKFEFLSTKQLVTLIVNYVIANISMKNI